MQKFSLSKHLKKIVPVFFVACLSINAYSESAFSGTSDGIIRLFSNPSVSEPDPQVTLENYFLGQTLFSPNIWLRTAFTVQTDNLLKSVDFSAASAKFSLNEISLTFHQNIKSSNNYLSLFYGDTDSCGTDIIFSRLFNLDSISSAITKPWTGDSHKLLFNQAGTGIQDIIRFEKPLALGLSAYANFVDTGYTSISTDLRFAGSGRFFSFDLKGGAEFSILSETATISPKPELFYWHAGTTILIGNPYTQSLFIQAGLSKGEFNGTYYTAGNFVKDLFLLVEPRFIMGPVQAHISLYAITDSASKNAFMLADNFGASVNLFFDSTSDQSDGIKAGINTNLALKDINILTLNKIMPAFTAQDFTILMTPYFEGNLFESKLCISANLDLLNLIKGNYLKGITFNAGLKTLF